MHVTVIMKIHFILFYRHCFSIIVSVKGVWALKACLEFQEVGNNDTTIVLSGRKEVYLERKTVHAGAVYVP